MAKFTFNEQIQRGILYLFKSSDDFHIQIAPLIKSEYFEFPAHQNIYTIIKDYREKYQVLPTDSIIMEEAKNYKKDREYISDYEDELHFIDSIDVSSVSSPEYYLDLIEKFARNQAMTIAIKESMILLQEGRIEAIENKVQKALLINRNVDLGTDYYGDSYRS